MKKGTVLPNDALPVLRPAMLLFAKLPRTARVARLTAIPATLVVVVASICLAGRMRKVQDIEGLARDAHRLGAYLIVMFRER